MRKLLDSIENLKAGEVRDLVETRLKEFKEAGRMPSSEIFKELCFCLLTANFKAEKSIEIHEEIGDDFLGLSESRLAKKLRELGHRYPNARAGYIAGARKHKDSLKDTIKSLEGEKEIREWLVKNIRGLGYKEASHFLRNIGYGDSAIIDFHIIDVLKEHGLVEDLKSLTKSRYLEIEDLLRVIAKKSDLNLAELDLYMWYMETGKVLK